MPFKLQWANRTGGRLATVLSQSHRPRIINNSPPSISTILHVHGHVGEIPTKFLIDSVAVMSVVCYKFLAGHNVQITKQATTAVGADGTPLDVVGHTVLTVSLGSFCTQHQFTVVQHLTVDCLLGADFLKDYGAVLDCRNYTLTLGAQTRHNIPIILGEGKQSTSSDVPATDSVTITSPCDLTIPGRTVQLIAGRIEPQDTHFVNVLVEPLEHTSIPAHVCVARSLSTLCNKTDVILQVMNVGPMPVTLCKGMRLATATPEKEILSITQDQTNTFDDSNNFPDLDQVDISHLSPKEQQDLVQLLTDFRSLFPPSGTPLGQTSVVNHSIPTTGPPIRQPLRRVPEALKNIMISEVDRMLDHNVICPSTSPWSSPVVMVRKPDGSWKFCIDYRKLNSITHRDAYPLPRIDSTLDSLKGATYFTTLDLASGYWQVAMTEDDKEKMAFSTPQGHFEFNVMPFGLTNAPATFQRLMECVLAGLSGEECLIYLDDVIVFSVSFKEHLERLARVFDALQKAHLKLKLSKCHFAQREIKYLGHIVSEKGIAPDPSKVEAVSSYPPPQNPKELKRFLGLSNYYRRFISNYANIAEPLNKLVNKDQRKFKSGWDATCQAAFDQLKCKLTTAPILSYPDFSLPFVLHTDASYVAIGGILSQCHDSHETVICYWSRQLTKAEKNYSTVEREALAAVSAIKEFYPYLYGFSFTLVTDHNPLTSLKGLKDVGGRLARWLMYLQQFNFQVKYRSGRTHNNADALSRRPPSESISIIQQLGKNHGDLQSAQLADPDLAPIITALSSHSALPSNIAPGLKNVFLCDGLLCRNFRQSSSSRNLIQIILPTSLKRNILQQLHDHSGHLGIHKTTESVKQRFYWPGYESDIEMWIKECQQCQQRNPQQPRQHAPLGTITASHPFQKVSWDIMGPLPTTAAGNKYILVVTDIFSKWTEAFPLHSTDSATLATILVNEVICRYGVPSVLHSDQGANLTSQLVSTLCNQLGINQTRTTAYHPQGNGQVERFNRTLEAMLSKTIQQNQCDWDEQLPKVMFAYRTAIHEATGYTPFHVTFGRSPSLPIDVMLGIHRQKKQNIPGYVSDLHRSLQTAYTDIRQNLRVAHKRNKARHDVKSVSVPYHVGDQVWLYVPSVKSGNTKKLASLWRGPYTVIDRINFATYKIQLISQPSKTLVVHHDRLKHCFGTPQSPPSPPVSSPHCSIQQSPIAATRPLYSAVLTGQATSSPGGYTSSDNSSPLPPVISPPAVSTGTSVTTTLRPQCSRRP